MCSGAKSPHSPGSPTPPLRWAGRGRAGALRPTPDPCPVEGGPGTAAGFIRPRFGEAPAPGDRTEQAQHSAAPPPGQPGQKGSRHAGNSKNAARRGAQRLGLGRQAQPHPGLAQDPLCTAPELPSSCSPQRPHPKAHELQEGPLPPLLTPNHKQAARNPSRPASQDTWQTQLVFYGSFIHLVRDTGHKSRLLEGRGCPPKGTRP